MKQPIVVRDNSREAIAAVFFLPLLLSSFVFSRAHAQEASASKAQPAHHAFTPGYTAKALPTHGALRASVHTFKAEDGTSVYQSDDWYKSASDARSALDTLTKRASRIIKQGTKKDVKGGIIGRWVELVFERGHNASAETILAWTDGAIVVRLRSTSLPLLLDFEEQYYPCAPSDEKR